MQSKLTRAQAVAIVVLIFPAGVFAADQQAGLSVERSRKTGLATFVRAAHGGAIDLPGAVAAGGPQAGPAGFLHAHGHLFGVTDPVTELKLEKVVGDELVQTHTRHGQVFGGVPVFGGRLHVHQNAVGAVVSANGQFFPIPKTLRTTPTVSPKVAQQRAQSTLPAVNPVVEQNQLVIVDPGWYGDPPIGAHLAYHLILADEAAGVREAFFVDAHSGKILDRWNVLHTIKNRQIFNDVTNTTVRVEGGPPTGDHEADGAYDYAGDTYDYLFRAFGRDSIDGGGTTLHATVHLQSGSCPNAFGGASGTSFCDGIVSDDVVAHEFGHGMTAFTAGLIYQNQSGQLNESFSDVFGEVVDLLNGNASFAGPPGGTPWPGGGTVGPGTDTPNDLRSACVSNSLATVNSPPGIAGDYPAQPASFGPALTLAGTTANVAVADPVRSCDVDLPFTNPAQLVGKIVIVNRGDCTFAEKVRNAQDAGAIAAIVVNNLPSGLPPMGGSDPSITIPSVGISQFDGDIIKNAMQSATVNMTLRQNANLHVRWLVGEDASGFGGAIRDMWQPSCMGDPDNANHPLQICASNDNGGVHSGSGVPNHAFAIAVDGKSYNNYSVSGIGLFKAAAVWYRALTVYLTPTSDFGDAYVALNQSADDLIGQMIKDPRDGSNYGVFTTQDAVEINNALLAVEMNTLGLCGANEIMNPEPPVQCAERTTIYSIPFSPGGTQGWTTQVTGPAGPPTPYNWVLVTGSLPAGRNGTAWFGEDRNIGNCQVFDESAVHTLFSPTINLPGSLVQPTAAFSHYLSTESGFDGGNVKISVNGSAWQLIPASAFTYNPYNTVLITSAAGNTNPIAGEAAWSGGSGASNDWGTSLIDLTSLVQPGDAVRFRFDMGKDGCAGVDGWYLDDFEVYTCPFVDCNENGTSDSTDISGSASADCQPNGIPDECEIAVGSPAPGGPFFCTSNCDADCNVNAIPDVCEVTGNDCDANQVSDDCDLADCAGDPACQDCNANARLDSCDLTVCGGDPACNDCNNNGAPDGCDIDAGATDVNNDEIPDQCQIESISNYPLDPLRTRFLSFSVPASGISGHTDTAVRVRLTSLHHVSPPYSGGSSVPFTAFEGQVRWVGPPASYVESASSGIPLTAAALQCDPHYRNWGTVGLIHVTGSAIVPSSIFEAENVAASCAGNEGGCAVVSAPVTISTSRWGDADFPYNPPSPTVQPDITDVSSLIDKFRNALGTPIKARALQAGEPGNAFGEITPAVLSVDFGFSHISACVDAYRGAPYPYTIRACP